MASGPKTTFHLIVILSVWCQSVHGGSENQPKLKGRQGDFNLQAAQDKNITIRLKGIKSAFMINEFNVLQSLQKQSTDKPQRSDRDITSLPFQVRRLMRAYQRLAQRTNVLEVRLSSAQVEQFEKYNAESIMLLQRFIKITTDMTDECASSPCKNGADCYGLIRDFHCDCPESWTGKTCEIDVDECETLRGTDLGCQNNATCVNLSGSYRCVCATGFSGPHCRERKSDCEKSAPGELCGKGVCIPANNEQGYKCICDAGWKTDGIREYCSVDVNECVEAHVQCHTSCINLPGSFMCGPCPSGYTGDGIKCQDIDECAVNNGGCSTRPKVQCINTEGSHQCGKCPPGWTGNGQDCSQTETNACGPNDICHPDALCQYISNIIVCQCPAGMAGTGYGPAGCTRIPADRCSEGQCKNGGICVTRGTRQSCICPAGYKQPFCETRSACASRPCFNGGMCVDDDSPAGFHCVCSRGSSGPLCQQKQLFCGSVIRDRSGELTYPASGLYEPNKACAWGIRTDYNFILNVTFSRFDLEAHPECGKDWLQINDGRSLATPLIGRFCGNQLPNNGNILSSHNTLFLWFRSDNTTNFSGFSLSFNSILPICGGHQKLDEQAQGVIKSPGYPGKSPRRRSCEWTFEAPFGKRILFRFYEVIMDNSANCTRDKLIIYDSLQPLEYVCATGSPAPIYTSSNEAKILFYTDDYLEDTLFQVHYEVVPANPGCGGVHSESKGKFQLTSDMQNCNFLIQLPPGTRVSVSFTKGGRLYGSPSIKIFDGKTNDDPVLTESENGNLPEQLVSSQNFLLISMYMLQSPMDLARSLVYEVSYNLVCGEELRYESGGTFMTPNYPKPYFTGLNCSYNFVAPLDSVVHLNITDYDISEYEDSCNDDTDFIEIYYGGKEPVKRHCKDVPMHIVSPKNILRIDFHSNANPQRRRGIAGTYWFEELTCGGVLRDPEGSFGSGGSFNPQCEWILEAPPTYVIELNITYIRLRYCAPGESDLQIFLNYTNSDARLVQSLCGGVKDRTTVLYSNLATVFRRISDSSQYVFSNFMISYKFIKQPSRCGGNYTDLSGNIQSPGFPSNYLDSMDCTWVIHAPLGHKIELVPKIFALEPSSSRCNSDYLEIRNGMSEQSPLIGKFCGQTILPHIPSFTNHIYLHFHSDATVAAAGFDILYQQTSSGCGGTLNPHSGSIASPHYPEIPIGEVQCDWKITVSRGSAIDLQLTRLSPTADLCTSNVLQIYDGGDSFSKQLLMNCSQSDRSIILTSSGSTVFVRYSLSGGTFADGQQFYLNYTTNCRQTLTSMEGVIESPNFPSDYPSYLRCEWTILGRQSDKIVLTFSHFELEKDDLTCMHDVFEVLDMQGEEILQKKKICNAMETQDLLTSDGNKFVVKFSSDYSHTASGFRLEFKRNGCGGYETRPRGALTTPNAPYSTNLDCEWLIETTPGMLIVLDINVMQMETDHEDCATNGLIVKNNKDDKEYLLKECQVQSMGMSATSQGTTMSIRFHTDSKRSRKFMKAFYWTKAAQCGGIFRSNSGTIMSPNYPNNYSENSFCEWMISTENAFLLRLNFITMDIPVAENCSKGFIEVYDGRKGDPSSKLIQRYCESKENVDLASKGNMVHVILSSNGGPPAKGFLMKYAKQCGFKIEQSSGLLKSYIRDQPCFWVYAPNDTESKLTITVLKLECHCEGLGVEECKVNRGLTTYEGDNKVRHFCESVPSEFTLTGQSMIGVRNVVSMIAKYSSAVASCGGRLASLRGIITSPYHPSLYPMNTECIWTISASPGNNIELSIDEMNLDRTELCNRDYVEVRESSENGKLLGAFCSNDSVSQSFKVFQEIWIKFHSGDTSFGVNSGGFKLSWTYAQLNELSDLSGRIEPPPIAVIRFEPEPFVWRILVPRDNVIWLAFREYNGGLQLNDGFDENALFVDIQMSPWEFTSSSNVILLKTDNKIVEHFQLEWKAQSKTAIKDNVTLSKCNEVFNIAPKGRIDLSSPGYPDGYEENLRCEWVVKPDRPTRHAVVRLYEVQLEHLINCVADYLQIFTSHNLIDWHEELKVCDSPAKTSEPFKIIHGTPYVKLKFSTDGSVNKTGFRSVLHTACGGNLTDSVGRIQANGLDYDFLNENCTWHIQVHQGRRIKFTFEFPPNTAVNSSDQCSNFAIIRDGINDDGVILPPGRICSFNQFNGTVLSTTNRATLKFYITPRLHDFNKAKWNITYREYIACGGEVRLTPYSRSVNFTSPNYPHVPNPHTECVWLIVAPPGETVRAEFVDQFSMNVRRCDKEFVEFRDGSTALARQLGKHCRRPATIRSSGNVLYMRYQTDIPEPRNGFKVNVSISTCGGTFTQFNNIITSPNYPAPGGYPANSVCDYVIKVNTFSRLNLTFLDVHLPFDSANLNQSDRIVVYQILDATSDDLSDELAVIYGNATATPVLLVHSNIVLIRFHTFKANNLYRGFRLKYDRMQGFCFRDISGESGLLTLSLPVNRRIYELCRWKITVPKGRRVKADIDNVVPAIPPGLRPPSAREFKIKFFNDFQMISLITSADINNVTSLSTVSSSDNMMYIVIQGLTLLTLRSMRVAYSSNELSNCTDDITTDTGTLSLANIDHSHNFFCKSDIPLNGRETLSINFTRIAVAALKASEPLNCVRFQGRSVMEPRNNLCNNVTNKNLLIPVKRGSIMTYQSENVKLKTFEATFIKHQCGGEYQIGLQLKFSLPKLESTYGRLDCAWVIFVGLSTEFELTGSFAFKHPCQEEYLTLHAGTNSDGLELARFCNNGTFNSTRLKSTFVYIEYQTPAYSPESLIDLTLRKANTCGGKLMVRRSLGIQFTKSDYKNNLECVWELQAETGFFLQLEFFGRFFIEDSKNCTKDYLIVRKIGDPGEWEDVGRFCGRETPPSINTTSQGMQLIFRTDNAVTADGFSVNVMKTCDGVFNVTENKQKIVSPEKWRTFLIRLSCNYTLVTDSKKYVKVKFNKFNFGFRRQCGMAQMTIQKKNQHGEMVELGPYCESNEISVVKANEYISLSYLGLVDTNTYEFEFSLDSCGGEVTTPQWIESQLNEQGTNYADNMNCVWYITAPADHNIIIQFKYLSMEVSVNCTSDYVEIYKGPLMQDDAREQRLCGNRMQNPPTFNIDSNRAVVAAVSDFLLTEKGFKARIMFSKFCKDRLTLTEANTPALMDRDFEVSSGEVSYCDNQLMAPLGFRIKIEFVTIDINPKNVTCQDNCEDCDYIEIVDSARMGNLKPTKVCRPLENEQAIISSFEDANVRAHFEQPGSHKFKLNLSLIKSDCGGQTEFEVKPDSPVHIASVVNSNKLYSPNVHCVWKITSKTSFHIRFDKFSLQNVSDVTGECLDYLQIKAKRFHFTMSSKHCGFVASYVSSTYVDAASVEITFHTDESIESTGFALTAMETLPCNGTHSGLSGSIRGSFELMCTNYIETPANHSVNIIMSSLYFSSSNCSENYIKVYDTNTNSLISTDCSSESFASSVFTSTNRVRVDVKVKSHSFLQLTYYGISKTLPPGCGGNLDLRSGFLVNPPYAKYGNATVCRWNFTTTPPNKIDFQFSEIDMGTKCRSNYLDIIDIASNGEEKLARHFCSQDESTRYISASNRVAIVTATTPEFDGSGWQLRFSPFISAETYAALSFED